MACILKAWAKSLDTIATTAMLPTRCWPNSSEHKPSGPSNRWAPDTKLLTVPVGRIMVPRVNCMLHRLWLIWSRAIDHRVGLTDEDKPGVPILKVRDANISLCIRTAIVLVNFITCASIVANIIHKWGHK